MAVKLKLNNDEMRELIKYISRAREYQCEDKHHQSMVRCIVFAMYRSFGNRYLHDDAKPSYGITLTDSDSAALMLYYDFCSLPNNEWSSILVQGVFGKIDKQIK